MVKQDNTPVKAPALDRNTMMKIGQQLRGYYEPRLMEHPTLEMLASLQKLEG